MTSATKPHKPDTTTAIFIGHLRAQKACDLLVLSGATTYARLGFARERGELLGWKVRMALPTSGWADVTNDDVDKYSL